MTEWHPLDSYYIWCWESESIKKHCIYSKSHFKSILLFGCRTNCDDVCMCVVNKQFELLEFISESVYVDLQYDEISLIFTAGSVCVWC